MSAMEDAIQHAMLSMLSKAIPQDQIINGFNSLVNFAKTVEDIRDTLHRIEQNGNDSSLGQLRLIGGSGPDDGGSLSGTGSGSRRRVSGD